MMKVAIVHHHLRPGGVTRVITHTVRHLQQCGVEVGIVSGEASKTPWACPVEVVPDLSYRDALLSASRPSLAAQMRQAATRIFGSDGPCLWHIHNPTLGKNPELPHAVHDLAMDGQRLLLHIHDLAEDGRATNYQLLRSTLGETPLYPLGPDITYGTINLRDAKLLVDAGVPQAQVLCLGNPVGLPDTEASELGIEACDDWVPSDRRLMLYPTRGIRRKNLGEFLLLAALSDPDTWWATTLGPANPAWRSVHSGWESAARECNLRVSLGLSERSGLPFSIWAERSHQWVTTSIQEGFGLAFLEPWLIGKSITGRDLPAITCDFEQHGIALGGLYDKLLVPLLPGMASRLKSKMTAAFRGLYASFDLKWDEDLLEAHWQEATVGESGAIDFAFLDEPTQLVVLQAVVRDGSIKGEVRRVGERDQDSMEWGATMKARIIACYAPDAYAETLHSLYRKMIEGHSHELGIGQASASSILEACMHPAQLRLLKTDPIA
jgi:hypothetical protein